MTTIREQRITPCSILHQRIIQLFKCKKNLLQNKNTTEIELKKYDSRIKKAKQSNGDTNSIELLSPKYQHNLNSFKRRKKTCHDKYELELGYPSIEERKVISLNEDSLPYISPLKNFDPSGKQRNTFKYNNEDRLKAMSKML